ATRITRSGTDDAPRIAALATGAATMGLKAGSLAAANVAVTVGTAGTGDTLALLPPRAGATPAPDSETRGSFLVPARQGGETAFRNPLAQWAIIELTAEGTWSLGPDLPADLNGLRPGAVIPRQYDPSEGYEVPIYSAYYSNLSPGVLTGREGGKLFRMGSRHVALVPPRSYLHFRINDLSDEQGFSDNTGAAQVNWQILNAFMPAEVATSSERVQILPGRLEGGITLDLPRAFVRRVVQVRAAGTWGTDQGEQVGPEGRGQPPVCTVPCHWEVPLSALVRIDDANQRLTTYIGKDSLLLVEADTPLQVKMQDCCNGDNVGEVNVWWDVVWEEP
ncbi:MAG: hypothetical protein VKP57_12585, partial [Candidatus Sericytochromatia bacterium]|nr:hypothetical protein [Candidatus Sericytochromatia bacterium]